MQVYYSMTRDAVQPQRRQREQDRRFRRPRLDIAHNARHRHDSCDRHLDQTDKRALPQPVLRRDWFACNSPTTLNYIGEYDETKSQFLVNEKGIKADGPLFDLPGGTVKMAIGANYTSYHFHIQETNQGTSNPTVGIPSDAPNRQVWAVLDSSMFRSSANRTRFRSSGGWSSRRPGVMTSTATWVAPAIPRSDSAGRRSFPDHPRRLGQFVPRAQLRRELADLQRRLERFNFPSGVYVTAGNATISIRCINGQPSPGSGGEKLFNAGIVDKDGKTGCDLQPAGLSLNGGGKAASLTGMRDYYNQEAFTLEPEISTNRPSASISRRRIFSPA